MACVDRSRQGVMHGYGGRKRSVPILRFVTLGYGHTAMVCFLLCWRGCRQNLWHKAASSSRAEEDPSTCCMTVTTRPYFDSSIRSVSVWFLFFFFFWVSFIDAALVFLCLSSSVCTLRLVCWNFVCVCFFNMFLELVNTFYCLAAGTLPLLLSSTYLFLFVTSSLSSKFLYPIHCRLF